MSVNDCDGYGGSGQLVDEPLTGHQWDIPWSQSIGGALGSLMADLSSAIAILHLSQVITRE